MFCAFIFDLYKWCSFIAVTKSRGTTSNVQMKERQKKLKYGLIIIQALIVLTFIGFIISMSATVSNDPEKAQPFDDIERSEFYFIVISFALFLVSYLVIFFMLTSRLRKYFPSFYKNERTKIYMASLSIIISIATRIVFVILYEIDSLAKDFDESYQANTWLWPVM